MAFVLLVAVGLPLGIVAALGHNRWPDYVATGVSMIGIATPTLRAGDPADRRLQRVAKGVAAH